MYRVVQGNRLERLADALVERLDDWPCDVLESRTVVVPHPGMGRWLTHRIAERVGIASGFDFPLPGRFLAGAFDAVLGAREGRDTFERGPLAWRVAEAIGQPLEADPFEPVRAWLAAGSEAAADRRRVDLACRIASAFDGYLVHRPDWIEAWEQGEDAPEARLRRSSAVFEHARWQAELWRRLVAGDRAHRVRRARAFLAALASEPSSASKLPRRVALFGVSTIPEAYLERFDAIAAHVEVDVYVMNPCREFWGDIRSLRQIARWEARTGKPAAELHLEPGHPLLASAGGQGRESIFAVLDRAGDECDVFVEPDPGSLLGRLQGEILTLARPARRSADPLDRSIEVRACHSPLREVEVLHDAILAMLDPVDRGDGRRVDGLRPSDVVVMTPDLETYGPLVEAVFGNARYGVDGRLAVPFTLADRAPARDSTVARTLNRLLDLSTSRYGLSDVLELLRTDTVRRKFGFGDREAERAGELLESAGVRWGLDASHRATFDVPATSAHTFEDGLDRIVLGWMTGGGGYDLWRDSAPLDGIGGGEAETVGRVCAFHAALAALAPGLEGRKSPSEWADLLDDVLDSFFETRDPDDPRRMAARERLELREALGAIVDEAEQAGFREAMTLDAFRVFLDERLEDVGASGFGFLSGGVTVCKMTPMRAVPFRVVCLLGIDAKRFPKADRPAGLDLIDRVRRTSDDLRPGERSPHRLGDRSTREDDRYLFLEALLSARDRLYVSYVGRSARDGAPLPASPLVEELLEALPDDAEGDRSAVTHVVEPLQPFARVYFDESSDRFTYRQSMEPAGGEPTASPSVFAARPIELDAEGGAPTVRLFDLDELAGFLASPAEHLLRRVLGLSIPRVVARRESREPFDLEPLERFGVRRVFAEAVERGAELSEVAAWLRAARIVPEGPVGDGELVRAEADACAFARFLRDRRGEPVPDPPSIDLRIGPARVVGQVRGLDRDGVVDGRPSRQKAKDLARLWVAHLAVCATFGGGRAEWVSSDDRRGGERRTPCYARFDSVAPTEARRHLATIVEACIVGASRLVPVPPESAFAYAKRVVAEDVRERAIGAARGCWDRGPGQSERAERDDVWWSLACRGLDPIEDSRFASLAEALWRPIAEALGGETPR